MTSIAISTPVFVALNEIQPLVGAYRIRPITKMVSIIRAYAIRPYRSHTVISDFHTPQLAVRNEIYTVVVDFPLGKNYW